MIRLRYKFIYYRHSQIHTTQRFNLNQSIILIHRRHEQKRIETKGIEKGRPKEEK